MKEVDANELINGVINIFRLKVEKYSGTLDAELNAEDPIVYVDEMHFTNVIFNLLDNAVKYKKPEGDLKLKVRTWNESGKLHISIEDNGIGIKKENSEEDFRQVLPCSYRKPARREGIRTWTGLREENYYRS